MNDEDDWTLLPFCRTRQIPFDAAVSCRGLHDFVANFNVLVIRLHLLRPGVVGSQSFEDCGHGQTADCKFAGAAEKDATVNIAVLVFVKQV